MIYRYAAVSLVLSLFVTAAAALPQPALSQDMSTIVCWYNANGQLTGTDSRSAPAGWIQRSGKVGDYANAYYISAPDGRSCPATLPATAVSGKMNGTATVFTLSDGSTVTVNAPGH